MYTLLLSVESTMDRLILVLEIAQMVHLVMRLY